MKQNIIVQVILTMFILLLGTMPVGASPAAQYGIINYTIDGGGQMNSSGGRFQLSGTIGQVDSTNKQVAGQRTLTGGFWNAYKQAVEPVGSGGQTIFLPLVSR